MNGCTDMFPDGALFSLMLQQMVVLQACLKLKWLIVTTTGDSHRHGL